jgi:hypothetical protein
MTQAEAPKQDLHYARLTAVIVMHSVLLNYVLITISSWHEHVTQALLPLL